MHLQSMNNTAVELLVLMDCKTVKGVGARRVMQGQSLFAKHLNIANLKSPIYNSKEVNVKEK